MPHDRDLPDRLAGAVSAAGGLRRRDLLAAGTLAAAGGLTTGLTPRSAWAASEQAGRKVLRLPLTSAETSLDPAKVVDVYSRAITGHIFEALYTYDHLARPAVIVPLTADALPEGSDDFRTWTVRVRRGIYFADDPAFKGQRRELVAADYAYAFRRFIDPANKSPAASTMMEVGFIGFDQLRADAVERKQPFDYDRAIEGIEVVDRYTLRFRLNRPSPRFVQDLTGSDLSGAVAREVVEHYGDQIGDHPVGTGPFKVAQWRRSSFIALERNPDYRERYFDAQPAADDAEGQAILAALKGKRIPMVDRVELTVIEESQPRWLTFLNGQVDALAGIAHAMPGDLVDVAMPGGQMAPNLAKRGIFGIRSLNPDIALTYFNMEDPVVGGYTPEKVALRRAIGLATDVDREILLIRRGQAIKAQSCVVPHTDGYDPALKTEMSDFDVGRANALLDTYGYLDRDGDGWREQPDGSPLVLHYGTQTQQISRQFDELTKRNLESIRIRVSFDAAKWPENLKAARAGKLQVWMLGSSADRPDSQSALARMYGPQAGGQNLARFKHARFDAIYERMLTLPNGPERDALYREAKLISVAFMPYKIHVHRISTDLLHPWVVGFRRGSFWQDWWHMVDIDDSRRPAQ